MKFIRIGHRGAPALEPENTLRSFRRAIEIGVDMVELDIEITRDGCPVILHDETIDRTSNGRGYVRDFTLRELKSLDFGKGERIPTFEEVLDSLPPSCKLHVDKVPKGWEEKVVDIVRGRSAESRVWYCGDPSVVKRLKELQPNAIITPTFSDNRNVEDKVRFAEDMGAAYFNCHYKMASGALVDFAREHNMGVICWTVDDLVEMRRLVSLGVEGIASNDPRLFRRI
ncbi:MAG: glycerophosphodiester phosphodiesterase [bacterium]